MKKQTKVLAAATLLTLGASFSALAATGIKNGTWVNGEDGWQYFDKEGEVVESAWCQSNGEDFWINDEGYLGADEWVTDEKGSKYYVKADGSMAVSEWLELFAEDDDEADEESWFWFDAKGRMAASKKVTYEGNDYCFDAEGRMLTGWVDTSDYTVADENSAVGNLYFCNADGSVAKKAWINEFPWNATEAELYDMYEGDDEVWYYAGSKGRLTVKKANDYTGTTYFFDNTTGEMLTGWVAVNEDDVCTAVSDEMDSISEWNVEGLEVYFADEDYGHAKKNGWRELDNVAGDTYWYHFDKLGRVFLATGSNANNTVTTYTFEDGEILTFDGKFAQDASYTNVETKKVDGVLYYFNNAGEMIDGIAEINDKLYYLDGGARQTGKVTLTDDNENDYTFLFAENDKNGQTKYVAANGNVGGYCYCYGQLMKAEESGEYEIVEAAGAKFLVDYRGKIQKNEKKEYDGIGYITLDDNGKDATKDSIIVQ